MAMSTRPCDVCTTLRKHYPSDPQKHRMHCLGCIHCGARLIQRVQRLSRQPEPAKRERCQEALQEWMAMGHEETEIRQLAKQTAWAVQPATKGAK
jgi:predicted  nucleic acid-binding Zn-ribbon protein